VTQETETSSADLTLHLGNDALVIRRRYEALSTVNDIFIGVWFTAGSILFFFESATTTGTWFFVIGSVELLVRPAIRLTRAVHLTRRSRGTRSDDARWESEQDF
jgi:hypothetical protein